MNWDDLQHVLALARHGTLSQAAAHLGATHTTVGRRLRAIEASLGARLFDQTPEGFRPTTAGREVIQVAERMESELQSLEARVLGKDARLEGKLRVATMDILFRRYEAAFASFVERHPGVDLTVHCADEEASLLRREADVALRMTNSPPEHLFGRRIGRVDFAVYASRRLAERVGEGASYADYPWIHWDERVGARWLDDWLAENARGASIAVRVDVSSLLLREVVASGTGVHFLAVSEGEQDPRLQRIGPIDPRYGRAVWLLTLSELKETSRVRAFMDHVIASAGAP